MVFTMCLWLDDLLHAHLPMVKRLDLRGEQCTAPVSGWCLDVKWMFGIEGWNEGFDLLRIILGMEFP